MTVFRALIAALALATAGSASAHDPYRSGPYGQEPYGWSGGDGRHLYVSDAPLLRHDRLSRQRGYFDHGRLQGATFDYDRGYPYERFDYGTADPEPQARRGVACAVEWTRGRRGEEVPVRVCRGG